MFVALSREVVNLESFIIVIAVFCVIINFEWFIE